MCRQASILMDTVKPKLNKFWNSYMLEPWDCWSIGLHTETPLNISNNQPIESWHTHGTLIH